MYVCVCVCVFFFFKQKTAYEIKECDWSSDVCSSDLYRFADLTFRSRSIKAIGHRVKGHDSP